MDLDTRSKLIDRYAEGPDVLDLAVAGASDAELDARPGEGEWSAREVVHHCADSEMTSAIRLRRLIAEDDPVIIGYNPDDFARDLFYSTRPIEASLAAVRAARRTSEEILRQLTDEQWTRAGTHSEDGPYSVETWLEIYAAHCHDHADQIRRARGATATTSPL